MSQITCCKKCSIDELNKSLAVVTDELVRRSLENNIKLINRVPYICSTCNRPNCAKSIDHNNPCSD